MCECDCCNSLPLLLLQQSVTSEWDQSARLNDRLARCGQWNDVERLASSLVQNLFRCHFDLIPSLHLNVRTDDRAQAQIDRVLQEDTGEVPCHNDQLWTLQAGGGLFARRAAA